MNTFPFTIVGFDLDGTLVDSQRDLAPAINHTLGTIGRDAIPYEETRALIGGGSKVMLERALHVSGGAISEEKFVPLFAEMLSYYEEHISENTVVYDGCLKALDELAALGCKLAVVTNKMERPARKLIKELGMTDRFAFIIGGDTLGPGRAKPAPDMIHETIAQVGGDLSSGDRFAMIGDSTYDVRAARNAGVTAVAFSFGYYDVPVEELGGDVLIDHWDALIPALKGL